MTPLPFFPCCSISCVLFLSSPRCLKRAGHDQWQDCGPHCDDTILDSDNIAWLNNVDMVGQSFDSEFVHFREAEYEAGDVMYVEGDEGEETTTLYELPSNATYVILTKHRSYNGVNFPVHSTCLRIFTKVFELRRPQNESDQQWRPAFEILVQCLEACQELEDLTDDVGRTTNRDFIATLPLDYYEFRDCRGEREFEGRDGFEVCTMLVNGYAEGVSR
jgi:hypothetical protein